MKLTFNIDYRTNWGESVYLIGDIPELGDSQEGKAIKMTFDGESKWSCIVSLPDTTGGFTYRYVVKSDSGVLRREWGAARSFVALKKVTDYDIFDSW